MKSPFLYCAMMGIVAYTKVIHAFVSHLPHYAPIRRCTTLSSVSKGETTTTTAVATPADDKDNQDRLSTFHKIFTEDAPLLDVRAEVEFAKGAFPNSVNIPILDDEQRHLVGLCYKTKGPEAAFELGKELVAPLKEQRLQAWKAHVQANPTGYLYCFRGGSRSQLSQAGLKEAGVDYPLVAGGYKAMRQFLVDELEQHVPDLPLVMIGGRTGSGKTHLLKQPCFSGQWVDLEGLANHRGSAFGALVEPQPTQINFENQLAIEFLKLRTSGQHPIFIEEEGRRIGQRVLPTSMYSRMVDRYPVVELETPMEERVQICMQDYVTDMFPIFQAAHDGDDAMAHEAFRQAHLGSLDRIKKRVPDDHVVQKQVLEALDLFQASGDESGFREPIQQMLHYYDKMYDYQAGERKGEVLFRGDSKAIVEWAESEEGRCRLATV